MVFLVKRNVRTLGASEIINSMKDEVLLDEAALKARGITYSRWHKNRLEREGKFPKRILFGNRIFWLKSEIDAWIAERISERAGGET